MGLTLISPLTHLANSLSLLASYPQNREVELEESEGR